MSFNELDGRGFVILTHSQTTAKSNGFLTDTVEDTQGRVSEVNDITPLIKHTQAHTGLTANTLRLFRAKRSPQRHSASQRMCVTSPVRTITQSLSKFHGLTSCSGVEQCASQMQLVLKENSNYILAKAGKAKFSNQQFCTKQPFITVE